MLPVPQKGRSVDGDRYVAVQRQHINVDDRCLLLLSPIADFANMSAYADIRREEALMRIRTPADLGALIRDRRKKLRLDQKALAVKVGVSR